MENQTLTHAATATAFGYTDEPATATATPLATPSGNANHGLRFTAKMLKHPETGATLREGFEAFSLAIELPFSAGDDSLEGKIANHLLGEKVKELVQLEERASWIRGEIPYDPKDKAATMQWWLAKVQAITTETIGHALFTPTTRAGAFGAKRWEQWLKAVFLPTLDSYYSSMGQEVMSKAKSAATLALMKQGRDMAEHNKKAFATRFTSLLESEDERVLEAITSVESQAAFDWVTSDKVGAMPEALEI